MTAVLLLHLAVAAIVLAAGRWIGRRTSLVATAVVPAVGAIWLTGQAATVHDGATPIQRWEWVDALGLAFSFRLDGFALLMGLVVTGVGALVGAYSVAYFDADEPIERIVRFSGTFVAFAGSMLGLVLADDAWTLFVFWELTSITSFVLIGLHHEDPVARAAAQRALLITAAGGLALMGGLVLVGQAAGTTSFSAWLASPPTGAAVEVGLVLILVGAFSKSAQVPFHIWLPGAMAAPTPVSAYLHSATMVKAGVVLLARVGPAFGDVGWWRPTIVAFGVATMLVGGIGALRQTDAKLLLAHGTVSQLGLLVVLLGVGDPAVTAAGVAVLLAHALFKSTLFLVVGAVDHATGTRDLRRLSGVGRTVPVVAVVGGLAAASMAGVPPLLGFVAKESALDALIDADAAWATTALIGIALGSVLTVAYSLRWWLGVFTDAWGDGRPATVHHRPAAGMVVPPALLTLGTVLGGVVARPLAERLTVASEALDPAAHAHLLLWAGIDEPLLISIAVLATGAGVHLLLRRRAVRPPTVSGERIFAAGLDGLLGGARRLTGVVQSGSLPAYASVIAAVLVAALAVALLSGAEVGPAGTVVADSPLQVALAAFTGLVAVSIPLSRRRFAAALLLGVVGYGVALVFALYGAPDLALTQVLVETLSLVVFLLVLRHLPEPLSPPPSWAPRTLRIGLAVAVGVTVAGFALVAGTVRAPGDAPVAAEISERSYPEAGGENVVNVILVDFRGIDTLGEITVLGIAAVGIASLVRGARRSGQGGRTAPRAQPSVILEQITRVVFPVALLVSVYVMARGHNAPGGGFAGGLVAGAAFVLRHIAGDVPRLRRERPLPSTSLIALGLATATATAVAPLLVGQDALESAVVHVHPPLIGDVKLVSSALFDLGVYVLVLGVVLTMLANLGADDDPDDALSIPRLADRPLR